MMKRSHVLVVIAVMGVGAGFLIWQWDELFPTLADFKNVARLGIPSNLVCVSIDASHNDCLYALQLNKKGSWFRKIANLKPNRIGEFKCPSLSLTPNDDRLFIAFGDRILEFSKDFNLIKALNHVEIDNMYGKDFNLNITHIYSGEKRVLFVNRSEGNVINVYDVENSKIEKTDFVKTGIDEFLQIGKGINTKRRWYTGERFFMKPPLISIPYTGYSGENDLTPYDYIDYYEEYGWLYSSHFPNSETKRNIKYFNPKSRSGPITIARGYHAVFGGDGFVYFLKGSGDLFRVSLKKPNRKELVYDLPFSAFIDSPALTPTLSNNRKFLIYQTNKKDKYGFVEYNTIVVFDLLNKEYREIKDVRSNIGIYARETVRVFEAGSGAGPKCRASAIDF